MIEIKQILDVEKYINDVDAVIFDLDDTLYPEKDYVLSGFKAVSVFFEEPDLANEMWNSFINGGCAIDETLEHRGLLHKREEALQIYRSHKPNIALFSGVAEMLARIGTVKKTGIITDGRPEGQREKIKALHLADMVDEIIITDELGGPEYRKPNEKAFCLMSQRLNVNIEKMVYIGDNVSKDFIAPRHLKMKSIFFNSGQGLYST